MASGDRIYLGSKAFRDFYTHEASIGTTEIVITVPFELSCIKYISNDDDSNDLLITFNTESTTGGLIGKNKVIKLKANEVLSELNIKVTSIKLKRIAGTGNVRLLGV